MCSPNSIAILLDHNSRSGPQIALEMRSTVKKRHQFRNVFRLGYQKFVQLPFIHSGMAILQSFCQVVFVWTILDDFPAHTYCQDVQTPYLLVGVFFQKATGQYQYLRILQQRIGIKRRSPKIPTAPLNVVCAVAQLTTGLLSKHGLYAPRRFDSLCLHQTHPMTQANMLL